MFTFSRRIVFFVITSFSMILLSIDSCQSDRIRLSAVGSTLEILNALMEKISILERKEDMRSKWRWTKSTCEEIRAFDPSKPSGVYTIDPDGFDRGEDPISVYCSMHRGTTQIHHNSISGVSINECSNDLYSCFNVTVAYQAPIHQIVALSRHSLACYQKLDFEFDCSSGWNQIIGGFPVWWSNRMNESHMFSSCNRRTREQNQKFGCGWSCFIYGRNEILPVTQIHLGKPAKTSSAEPKFESFLTLGPVECYGQRQGFDGAAGPPGLRGSADESGNSGRNKDADKPGPPGESGPRGEKGERGLTGPPGPPGVARNLKLNCRDSETQPNVWDLPGVLHAPPDGHIIYLDKHHVKCNAGEFISHFRYVRQGNLRAKFVYQCCSYSL